MGSLVSVDLWRHLLQDMFLLINFQWQRVKIAKYHRKMQLFLQGLILITKPEFCAIGFFN